MSVDLTEITETVARTYYDRSADVGEKYDDLLPEEKVGMKGVLLPIIHQTATLVEDAVRREIRLHLDLLPRADLGGMTVSVDDAIQAAS
jgi:hypothetical protein